MTDNKGPEGRKVAESPIFKRILEKAEAYLKHPSKIASLISDTLKKATAKKGVGAIAGEVWENLQLLSRMLKAASTGEYKGIPTATLVGGVAVLIYFLMPIDVIPDIIPVIGLLDDASLLAWFMASIKTELDKFKEWEATRPIQVSSKEAGQYAPEKHDTDISFSTPKYSDRSAGDVQPNAPHAHHNSGEAHEGAKRAYTTDSSREPKNPNDDLPTGGNIR